MIEARTKHRSGTGAAHTSFAMFGARGPLLSPEGEGGGAAGAASGEGGAGTASSNAGSEGGKAAEPKTFTQAQLDAIVQERLASDRKARTTSQQQQAAPKSTDEGAAGEKLTMASLKAMLDESNARSRRAEFKQEALEAGFSKDNLDDAFALYEAQKPEDRTGWFEKKSKIFGSGATNGSGPAGSTNASSAQQAKIAAAPNATAPHEKFVDTGGTQDIYRMDPAKLEGLSSSQIRELHERNVRTIGSSGGAPPPPRISMPQPKR